jgi:hypothetical protein
MMIINLGVVSKSNEKWRVTLLALMGAIVCHSLGSQHGVAGRAAMACTTFHEEPAAKGHDLREAWDFTNTPHHPAATTIPVQWTT